LQNSASPGSQPSQKEFLGLVLLGGVFACDWSDTPFASEHSVKVIATFSTVVSFARMGAAAYRLSGGAALDPMLAPAGASTPAEFWRRWNRPAQQFLETYAFRPAGGPLLTVSFNLATSVLFFQSVNSVLPFCSSI
jgi:hypothetical protein